MFTPIKVSLFFLSEMVPLMVNFSCEKLDIEARIKRNIDNNLLKGMVFDLVLQI
jgi:hypothetical protein